MRSSCSSSLFSIVYYNARSLLPKMDELAAMVSASRPAVVCIVETWLCDYILNSEICLPDYAIIRLDRNRHGGGVLMYVHSSLDFNVLFRGYSDIELLAVSISINRHNICLSVAYRPPSSPAHFFDVFFEAICELHTYKYSNVIFVGDFNVNFFNVHSLYFYKLQCIMSSFLFSQMVQVPTHINPSGFDSLLDLVLVSDSDRVSSCLPIPPLANSDHLGLCLLLFTSVPRNFSCKNSPGCLGLPVC